MSVESDVDLVSVRFGRDAGQSPPIGLLYLGASLDAAGLTWSYVDCQMDQASTRSTSTPLASASASFERPSSR